MSNLIVFIILVIILGRAVYYIVSQKKKGVRCVGCDCAGRCPQAQEKTINCNAEKH